MGRTFAHRLGAPRPLWLLQAIALGIGLAWALTMLPLGFIAGSSDYWTFPRDLSGQGGNDMAQVEAGYLALVQTPWTLPLLYTPLLGAPAGSNIFWMDAVPWVSLLGRAVHSATGATVNLLGAFLLACLALPGVAMTTLLAAAGVRGLIAAVAGSLIAVATPILLFRWGHIPHSAHFWLLAALTLYLLQRRRPREPRLAVAWTLLLPAVLLTNVYLFAMASGCWGAALLQRLVDRTISIGRAGAEMACLACVLLVLMALTGILSPDLESAGTAGFGFWSMNLLSPVVPQMSGLLPRAAHFRLGMPGQYEGFAWLGGGVLLLGVLTARAWVRWLRARWRAHWVLLCVFALFFLFALSNRVYAGAHLLLDVPLPPRIVLMLGTFRASGRFFWPIGYAFAAGSIVLTLRAYRPAVSVALLALAALLQVIDVQPLRAGIVAVVQRASTPAFDRAAAAALIARAREVKVFPSFDCADRITVHSESELEAVRSLKTLNLEFQLLAVRQGRPTNSVYSARPHPDCAAETAEMRQRLQPGILTVWLTNYQPTARQIADGTLLPECATTAAFGYCLLPGR